LLANRSVDPASTSLTHRVRQQAGSYRFCAASGVVCQDTNPADAGKRHRSQAHHRYSHEIHFCRSRLAGEQVRLTQHQCHRHTAFASKPAPTGSAQRSGVCSSLRIWSVQASTITARLHHHIRMKSISAQRSEVCSSPRIWSVQATAATAARHYRSQAHHHFFG
jgi:hypothetical protein